MRRTIEALAASITLAAMPAATIAHAPSVLDLAAGTPETAVVLDDPTLSRAIGSTIGEPGEMDWYRMDLVEGDPLVVGITAPDAVGAVAATFTLLGPGLQLIDPRDEEALALAQAVGAIGGIAFEPAADPPLEIHGGLGFVNYGTIRTQAPTTASYWVAVQAVDPEATGKYVFAPGVREEFGPETLGGMADLISFFAAPWPPVTPIEDS